MSIRWRRWSVSDVGNRRAVNEDALVTRDIDGLWAVIDGLGGPEAGTVASAALAYALEQLALVSPLADSVEQLEDIVLAVHQQLVDYAQQLGGHRLMGATTALIRMTRRWSLVLWVGDVRCYRWRRGRLQALTEDHVGLLGEDLTRLIGAGTLWPDIRLFRAQPGDRYLLCSDGLHGELSEDRLAYWMGQDPAMAERELLAEALAAGGRDNISLILLDVSGVSDGER